MLEWIKGHLQWIAGGAIAIIVGWYLLSRPKSSAGAPTTVSFPTQTGGGGDTTAPAPTAPAVVIPPIPTIGSQDIQNLYHIMFPPGAPSQPVGPPTFNNWLSQFLTLQPNLSAYSSALSQAYAFIVANQQYFTNSVEGSLVSQGQGFANQAAIINAALNGQTLTTSGLETLGPEPSSLTPSGTAKGGPATTTGGPIPITVADLQLSPLTVKGR